MKNKGIDMVEFQRLEDYEECETDYDISSIFPNQPQQKLRHLIDYRIKLLLRNDVTLRPSESQLVNTACKISKTRPKLSMHLKAGEHLPVVFESEGFICPNYTGVVSVKLTNYGNIDVKLSSGTVLGYIIMQPFAVQ